MKFGAMLGDVFQSLFRRPVTRDYPVERKPAPDRLRGKLHWDPTKCTGCRLCSKDCPANAIEVTMVDKATKRIVMTYHMDRCTFCAQCVRSCSQNALELSNHEWELAGTNKAEFTLYYGDEADVQQFLDSRAGTDPKLAEEKE